MRNVREIQNVQETWIWQWRRWLFWHIIEFDRWEDDHSVIFSNLGGGEDDHSGIEKLCYVVWRLLLLCCFADQHYTVAPARRRTSAHCRRRPACGFCPHQYTRSILYYLAHQHRLIQEEIRVDLPFRIVSIVFQTGAGAGFRSHLCDGEGRKEGRKGAVLSVRRGWTLWQQQRLHQCSRQDNNNRKSLVLSLLLPISCRIFESFLLLFAFSLTGTAILSEEGALLCCVAWEVSAACIVLIRVYCEIIDRSVQRRRAAGVSILCCFRRRCSYERLVSLRRCSLLCSGLSAIACTQQRSCSTRVYRRHGQAFSVWRLWRFRSESPRSGSSACSRKLLLFFLEHVLAALGFRSSYCFFRVWGIEFVSRRFCMRFRQKHFNLEIAWCSVQADV